MKALIAAAATAALLAGAAHADDLKIKPGEWETTTSMSIVMDMGGQSNTMPDQNSTTTECVTEEDATFSPEDLSDESCTISNLETTSNSISFDMACNQGGMPMSGSVEYTLKEDRESGFGVIVMSGGVPGQVEVSVAGTVSSKRIGACQ